MWNDRLDRLDDFPFRRLARLLQEVEPRHADRPLDLSIGEPRHDPPVLLAQTVAAHAGEWNRYPPAAGTPTYRRAAADWLSRRFALPAAAIDPDRHILPVAGTKEALFLIAQTVVPPALMGGPAAILAVPNPVYSTYVGAAVMAGADPLYLQATAATGFLPDLGALSPDRLERCAAFYVCSPANPQGAVADLDYLGRLVRLARAHDFLLVADECYCELYDADPPPSAIQAALADDGTLRNVVAMHSLSKRSSAPGLRAGFCVGDEDCLGRFLRLRAYGAAVQPLPLMAAAAALWGEDEHVAANRARYRRKFDLAQQALGARFGFYRPAGGFFLWLDMSEVASDGEAAALHLWREAALKVLPGSYLAVPDADGLDPGRAYVRVAMVPDEAAIEQAVARLAQAFG